MAKRDGVRTAARWLGVNEGPGPTPARTRRGLFARLLATADALAAMGGVLVLSAVSGQPVEPAALLLVPLIILVSKIVGLYDRDDVVIHRSTLDEAPALFQLATITALGGWMVEEWLGSADLAPGWVLAAGLALFLLLVLLRMGARRLARRVAPRERVLFVGDRASYGQLRAKLEPEERLGVHLLGWVPFHTDDEEADDGLDERSGPALGTVADLPTLVGRHDVHRVIVVGSSDHREMLDVVRLSKLMGAQVSLLPALLDVVGSSVQFEDLHGLRLMGVRSFGLSRSSRFVKRSLDVAGAGLGLLVLAPLFAAVAVAVKLDSPGPILFCQIRVGRNGRRFGMRKFRSMVEGAEERQEELRHLNEAEGLFKIADDPRITRVGRWLRRTSLDELPQLVNVLLGEMSLVGPRPLVEDDDERIQGWHRQRLQLTPGMTGPWQVLGSSRVPLDEMVKIDYLYVANWSLWDDLKIMLRTVPVVFRFRGL